VLAPRAARAYAFSMAQPDCPICGGTGWKIVEGDTARNPAQVGISRSSMAKAKIAGEKAVVFETQQAGYGKQRHFAVPCDCGTTDRTARVMIHARIPARYEHCDFENFDTDPWDGEPDAPAWNRSLEQARLVVEGFARDFPVGTETGLLLMGSCGAGKTHLAVAALKQLVLRGHDGLFYDYRELLKEIQASYNPESSSSEMGVLEPVLKTEILLLDDLGASKPSPWAMDMLGHILNVRYNEKRTTLLTTNYLDGANEPGPASARQAGKPGGSDPPTSSRLPSGQAFAAREDTLSERIGHRIRSRLFEMCRTIEMNAPDYRREIRQAGRVGPARAQGA
jgi:DNA replication protein DnaC